MQVLLLVLFISTSFCFSRPENEYQIPNGFVNSCLNFHVSQAWGSSLNEFGIDTQENISGGLVDWARLSITDSDEDGFTNGEELQDPSGTFTAFGEQPENTELVTNPGDMKSFPSSVESLSISSLRIFPNPSTNHINVSFELSKYDIYSLYLVNSSGQKVTSLFFGFLSGNYFQKTFNVDLPYGSYQMVIESNEKIKTTNIIINN